MGKMPPVIAQTIQFRRYGHDGPLVALLHGGPGAAGEMAPLAEQLSARFVVMEPLQRAGGGIPLTVAAHVADLHRILQKPLRTEAVRLVGFSWGAMLAMTYAARHPAGVDRVVAVGCGTFDKKARQVYQTRMAERMNETAHRRMNEIQTALASEKDQARRDMLFAELGHICTRLQAFDPMETDSSESLRCDEKAFCETWADVLSLQEQGLQPAEFSHITAPVTLIHGDADPHPGRLIYESLRPVIRELAYVEIPQCGHKPWIERRAADIFHAALIQCLT
jgi:pimeloyl-ACP methyl ester carboxylesterase